MFVKVQADNVDGAAAPSDGYFYAVDEGEAEGIGFGTCFVSERFNVKEAATICGAAGAASTRIRVATGGGQSDGSTAAAGCAS